MAALFELPPESTVIDVSQHQGVIDWSKVVTDPIRIQGAYIRASMGVAGVDARLYENARASDHLPVGFYHLLRPEHDGAPQAEHFLNVAPWLNARLPLAVDVELDGRDVKQPQTPERVADVLRDFARRLQDFTGELPVIYTGAWFWNPKVGSQHDALFAQCPLWVAQYGVQTPMPLPRGFTRYWLWQHTSNGAVDGISSRVDMNRTAPAQRSAGFRIVYPVDQPVKISQAFGENLTGDPTFYTKWGFPGHEGVDFAGKQGDPVYNVASGTVKTIYRDDGVHPYGNHVRVTHRFGGDVYETVYAHLRGFVPGMIVGDDVNARQKIGFMGNTGNVVKGKGDGTHLHFTLKKLGATQRGETDYAKDVIDPEPLFIR